MTLRRLCEAGGTQKQPAVGGAAAKGAEHIDAHDKGATVNKKVMAHVCALTSVLFTPGFCLFRVKKC